MVIHTSPRTSHNFSSKSKDEQKRDNYLLCNLHCDVFPVPGTCYRHFSAKSNRIHQEDSGRLCSKGIYGDL